MGDAAGLCDSSAETARIGRLHPGSISQVNVETDPIDPPSAKDSIPPGHEDTPASIGNLAAAVARATPAPSAAPVHPSFVPTYSLPFYPPPPPGYPTCWYCYHPPPPTNVVPSSASTSTSPTDVLHPSLQHHLPGSPYLCYPPQPSPVAAHPLAPATNRNVDTVPPLQTTPHGYASPLAHPYVPNSPPVAAAPGVPDPADAAHTRYPPMVPYPYQYGHGYGYPYYFPPPPPPVVRPQPPAKVPVPQHFLDRAADMAKRARPSKYKYDKNSELDKELDAMASRIWKESANFRIPSPPAPSPFDDAGTIIERSIRNRYSKAEEEDTNNSEGPGPRRRRRAQRM